MTTLYAVIDDKLVLDDFRHLVELVESPKDFYREAGEALLISTRERIQRGVTPTGEKFTPLEPSYAARKLKKVGNRPILEYDLHMAGDRFDYSVDDEGLLIESKTPYARAQQFGFPDLNIPARPWLGLSDDDLKHLKSILSEHLLDAVRHRF